jgi:hypothetical protein
MERQKYLPPKFSHSLKDLSKFLGIFELSEEDLKQQKERLSETSSSFSNTTQGMYKANQKN